MFLSFTANHVVHISYFVKRFVLLGIKGCQVFPLFGIHSLSIPRLVCPYSLCRHIHWGLTSLSCWHPSQGACSDMAWLFSTLCLLWSWGPGDPFDFPVLGLCLLTPMSCVGFLSSLVKHLLQWCPEKCSVLESQKSVLKACTWNNELLHLHVWLAAWLEICGPQNL